MCILFMCFSFVFFFFFKQKTAYEIGLGIPAEPLFRSLYSSRISLRGRSAASLRQNCVTVFSFSKNHFSSPSGRWSDRKSGSAGMPRPISYAVFCLKKKKNKDQHHQTQQQQTPRHSSQD